MTATTRGNECTAERVTLYLAFELGSTKWVLAFTTSPAQAPRHRQVTAGDLAGLQKEVLAAKVRFGLALEARVRSCYEAGAGHTQQRARADARGRPGCTGRGRLLT